MELTICNLTKNYGKIRALDDFSFTASKGVYGLLGPNGAGKTTLINITALLLQQDSGNVYWDGNDISALGKKYREILGYLPQNPRLYSNFTAIMFLKYMAALKGIYDKRSDKKQLNNLIFELLEKVNLEKDAKRKVGGFSGGMKQRLGIAQALLNDPKLLILDEPTSGLDPRERVRLRSLIASLSLDRTVIWATHIVSDVESIANDVVIMKSGRILMKDSPALLCESMTGKVWSIDVPAADTDQYIENFSVCGMVRNGDTVSLRIVSIDKPHETAISVTPNLEDLYLFHFDEKSEVT
ncbi:MAG: ABC transporter ATP-binding protein [Oscillospiraceae bacterium]|jgi:ABC-type multidrug transport system ATPase subunit|nr:ABC transporter ATP-binding protein [Oscillospiraceae bacterium]